MSIALGLALIAQSAAPLVADAPQRRGQIAVSVTAAARVIKPAVIRADGSVEIHDDQNSIAPQHYRDAAGTNWIEFS